MKILLTDDESFVLKLFARQLANLGFTEVTCMSTSMMRWKATPRLSVWYSATCRSRACGTSAPL